MEIEDDSWLLWGVDDESDDRSSCLLFDVLEDGYGVLIEYVLGVVSAKALDQFPEMPALVKGTCTFGGVPIPVLDGALRLGSPEPVSTTETSVVILMAHGGQAVGLMVDGARGVALLPEGGLSTLQMGGDSIVEGAVVLEERRVMLLDVPRLCATAPVTASLPR